MDIFYRDPAGQWWAISPGVYPWRLLGSSSFPLDKLRFGDFNGDGVTDILAVQDGHWAVSWGGTTTWAPLNPALRDPVAPLLIGDLDADGRDDLVRYTPSAQGLSGTWEVSWGGRAGWTLLDTFTWQVPAGNLTPRQLLFGWVLGIGRGFEGTVLARDALLLEGPFSFIPCRAFRSRSVEGNSQRDRDFRGGEQKKDEILAQDHTTTGFVAEFVEIGNVLGRFRAWLIRIIDDQTAVSDAIVMQQDTYTGNQE